MKQRRFSQGVLLSCAALSQNLFAGEDEPPNENAPLEELLVLGSKRQGDYTLITQDTEKLVDTAGAMGDPLSAIFALPGVIYSDGQKPAVRGSSPSDNQFEVDFLPASYIFHEFGVSIFSEYILHDFQMYSAGFGPEYNNATGAVFDVRLRQPENKPLSAILDLSMLRTGVFLEGGVTDSSAFYLSYRQSMLDLFVSEEDISDDGINFTRVPKDRDYQAKYSWEINDNNRLTLSANGAGDDAEAEITDEVDFVASNPDFAGDAKVEEKYSGQSVLWEYANDKGTEFTLGYGLLDDESNLYWGDSYVNEIRAKQSTLKARYSTALSESFRLNLGSQVANIEHNYFFDAMLFVCTEFQANCDENRTGERVTVRNEQERQEVSHYLNGIWSPSDAWQFDVGVQYQTNDFTEEEFYHPRIAAAWNLKPGTTLTAKAGRYNRFPDLETILPETGNPLLKSPTAKHYTLGIEQELDGGWSVSVEAYYKTLENLPRAIPTDDPNADLRYVNETEGKAQGLDLMLNKNRSDKWWGWIALSYGKSERTDLSTGETKDYNLDTPFIANWVMNYQFRPRFNIGWRWSIRSGQADTPIVGIQENPWFEDSVLPVYGDPFSERLPYYNRLDIRFQWDTTVFGKDAELIVDILNALNYANVSERNLDYEKVKSVDDNVYIEETQDMGIQPALSFRMRF